MWDRWQKCESMNLGGRPALRAWLQVGEDMERYVNPLRTPESIARSKEGGSEALRERIKAYLAKLDDLHGQ